MLLEEYVGINGVGLSGVRRLRRPGSPLSIFTHKNAPGQYHLLHTKDGVDAHLS